MFIECKTKGQHIFLFHQNGSFVDFPDFKFKFVIIECMTETGLEKNFEGITFIDYIYKT